MFLSLCNRVCPVCANYNVVQNGEYKQCGYLNASYDIDGISLEENIRPTYTTCKECYNISPNLVHLSEHDQPGYKGEWKEELGLVLIIDDEKVVVIC